MTGIHQPPNPGEVRISWTDYGAGRVDCDEDESLAAPCARLLGGLRRPAWHLSNDLMKTAVIGGGITGISAARMLSSQGKVTVFESCEQPGGLIRCERHPEGLYHRVGGHVFNTKSPAVDAWFWRHFDREREFFYLTRSARIWIEEREIDYPLENHLDQLSEPLRQSVLRDLNQAASAPRVQAAAHLKDALLASFGPTLCELYFFPYNKKIWRRDLAEIPMGWLEGKLPLPSAGKILRTHVEREPETGMVHATFYYAKNGGAQFIIDRLADGLDLRLNTPVTRLERTPAGGWRINGDSREEFDAVIFTGDLRRLAEIFPAAAAHPAHAAIGQLRTRGITTVFCECDQTTASWLYLPEPCYAANRIIYTGLFSPSNNGNGRMTCVVEFVFGETESNIARDLARLPGNLRRVAKYDARDAYVIQTQDTRDHVGALKQWAGGLGLELAGRFAEWEYYNMDKAIEAALSAATHVQNRTLTENGTQG